MVGLRKHSKQHSMRIAITDRDYPYGKTNQTDYVVKGHMIYPGAKEIGIPRSVKVNVWVEDTGTISWRIYDVTNAVVIASGTSVSTTPVIDTDFAPVNIPDGEADWEVQIKTSSVTKDAFISTAEVRF